jgi:hypothetical protein
VFNPTSRLLKNALPTQRGLKRAAGVLGCDGKGGFLSERQSAADGRFRLRPAGFSGWPALIVAMFRRGGPGLQSGASIANPPESLSAQRVFQRPARPGFGRPGRAAAVLVLIALSGCARLALLPSNDPLAELQQARSEQDFDKALAIARHLEADHPDHDRVEALLPELRTEIEKFEEKTIQRANKRADQGQWDQVWRLLADAMAQWRPSPALRQARRRLRQQEEKQRRQTTGELLVAEARWRLSRSELADRLADYTDSASDNRQEQWRQRNRELARALVHHGRWFSEHGDWARAHDYVTRAQALHAEAVPESLLARVRDKHQAQSRRSRSRRERQQRRRGRQRREKARALLAQYRDNGELQPLLQLRTLIRKDGQDLPEKITARVQSLSRERFRAAMARGDKHYARGDYRQARSIWKQVRPLAPPDSGLPEKLERVRRVLDNLQNLDNSD